MNEQSLKDKLQLVSKELDLPFNYCLRRFVLERFLVRLSLSVWREHFIFKGGMLLAQYIPIGRETIDLDFLAKNFTANEAKISQAMREISAIPHHDDFNFEFLEINYKSHEHTAYPGFEATFQAHLLRIKERFFIDIGVGDVVNPNDESIDLLTANKKPFFENSISLFVYPIESIFAEKIHTIVARGARNSRMKDYHDVYLMIQSNKLTDKERVLRAISETFNNRNELLKNAMLLFTNSELELLQKLWSEFRKGLNRAKALNANHPYTPEKIEVVITAINNWFK